MSCPVCKRISQALTMLERLGEVELDAKERKPFLNADGSLNTERYGELVLVALTGLRHFCDAQNIDFDARLVGSVEYVQEDLQAEGPQP